MGIVILILASICHYLLSMKIDYWMTISALGQKLEVPLAYMNSSGTYRLVNAILGIAVVLSPLTGGLEVYVGVIAWIIIWLASGVSGRNAAYNKYRQIAIEVAVSCDDSDEKERYQKEAAKSNDELAEQVKFAMKHGL